MNGEGHYCKTCARHWSMNCGCKDENKPDSVIVYALPTERQPSDTPIIDRPVLAIVQHWHTKGRRFAVLNGVNKDDYFWQTVDDGSELSHDWNVVAWDYLPNLEKT